MGNNANAIPTRGSPEFRGYKENQDYGTNSHTRCDDTDRTKAKPYAKQSGKETDGRTERTFGPIGNVNERQTENLRTHYTVRERHASWSPKPSVQNKPLVSQPTIEIQPLTDEMLMAELPRYKKPENTMITLPNKITNFPGLNRPYSRHRNSEERQIKGKNPLIELKEAIIEPPPVAKKDLPGLNKPFSNFANENKHTEIWPSLNSTAHFEQYLPKEKRDPKLIAQVEEIFSKRSDTQEIVEDYLVELKKDLIQLNKTDEEIHETINIDLIKEDLEPIPLNQPEQERKLNTKQDETQKTELKLIGGELARHFINEKLVNDKIVPPSEPRQLEIGRIRQELLDPDTDSSETILDTLEDTLQDLEYENSLDKIPDFPKDETEANEVPSANTWDEQSGLTGFESRPFDLTKLPNKNDNADHLLDFKSRLSRNRQRAEKDYTLVEHGYAKQNKPVINEPLQEKASLYEHGYAQNAYEKKEKIEHFPDMTHFKPNVFENLKIEKEPPILKKEKSNFENWPKFNEDNSTKTDGDIRLEHDWARLENLGRANRKPNLPGLMKPFRSFRNQEN